MKIILPLFLFLSTISVGAEDLVIPLDPIDEEGRDYGPQLIKKFKAVIQKNEALGKAFGEFSEIARERSGGKYLGPEVGSLVLHRSEEVDFTNAGGWRTYSQTVVIHYSFAEGFHKGMQAKTGVFAIFEVSGKQTYDHRSNDDFQLSDHRVAATFRGFQSTLEADENEDASPDNGEPRVEVLEK